MSKSELPESTLTVRESLITRRIFLGALGATAAAAQTGWVELFDGQTLNGWRANENPQTWKVSDGHLVADGPRSHLLYVGPVRGANFRNFELEVEAQTGPGCNSGVCFHTEVQATGWLTKGFEAQVNNMAGGEGDYRERKKTGSLYGVRNVYKQLVADGEWFTMNVAVRGKNIQIRLNGVLLVDYTESTPPLLADRGSFSPVIDQGAIALQGHDPGSKIRYRSVRVRPLDDDIPTPNTPPAARDALAQQILNLAAHNVPVVDYHVHLKAGLTLEQALRKSRRDGIQYGIAVNCGKNFPVQDDPSALRFLKSMEGQPVFVAMQAEGREWTQMFSRRVASQFDYIFTDSMTWTDNHGRRMRLWIPEEVGAIADSQEFMDTLVDRAVGILDHEPIDIYVNPTYLPAVVAKDYDLLWTEERMRKVIDAAKRNDVAIEINNRYKLPSTQFLGLAKETGCKFSFGTNNSGPDDLGRCEYGVEMAIEHGLAWKDFFVPGAWGPKAVERKPDALRG